MHPLLWEYMKHSQQSNYNGDSLNDYGNRIPTKAETVVRDASCLPRSLMREAKYGD